MSHPLLARVPTSLQCRKHRTTAGAANYTTRNMDSNPPREAYIPTTYTLTPTPFPLPPHEKPKARESTKHKIKKENIRRAPSDYQPELEKHEENTPNTVLTSKQPRNPHPRFTRDVFRRRLRTIRGDVLNGRLKPTHRQAVHREIRKHTHTHARAPPLPGVRAQRKNEASRWMRTRQTA